LAHSVDLTIPPERVIERDRTSAFSRGLTKLLLGNSEQK
jgi:hypothetical protein